LTSVFTQPGGDNIQILPIKSLVPNKGLTGLLAYVHPWPVGLCSKTPLISVCPSIAVHHNTNKSCAPRTYAQHLRRSSCTMISSCSRAFGAPLILGPCPSCR
jgi:hypothetical protein